MTVDLHYRPFEKLVRYLKMDSRSVMSIFNQRIGTIYKLLI